MVDELKVARTVKQINTVAELEAFLVEHKDKAVVITLLSDACPHCTQYKGIMEMVFATKPADKLEIAQINLPSLGEEGKPLTDDHQLLVAYLQALGVPTTYFYLNGIQVERKIGVPNEVTLLGALSVFLRV